MMPTGPRHTAHAWSRCSGLATLATLMVLSAPAAVASPPTASSPAGAPPPLPPVQATPGAASGAMPSAPMAASCGATERVSLTADGGQGSGGGGLNNGWISVSEDGRFVAFTSDFSNLVANDTNGALDVFVRDRVAEITERVSIAADGSEGNADSWIPSLNADGRFVAFYTDASNLVPDDTNDALDVFVRDRQTGTIERVSIASDGTEANGPSIQPALDADGRYIAFESDASNLVPGDTNNVRDVFVHDRQTGTTERVSVSSDGGEHNGEIFTGGAQISADGRFIAFHSDASNLVPHDTNNAPDVFVHDRQTGTTERVSVAGDGVQGDNLSSNAAISGDGRHVAFHSTASNLDPDVPNPGGIQHIYVHDRQTATTEGVSVAGDGTAGNSNSSETAISADGRYVAYISQASNLVPDDVNGVTDAFVHDREIGHTTRVSVASDCTPGNDHVFRHFGRAVGISADGRHVAFAGWASNLVADDTNGAVDVFAHTLPVLATAPNPLDFGPVLVGETRSPLGVTVSNTGPDDVTVSDVSAPQAPFTAVGGSCGGVPFTLAPGEHCELDFGFTPDSPGTVSETVTLASDAPDGPHTLALRGTGSEEPLHVAPQELDFGEVIVDQAGGPLPVTLTNAGSTPIEILAISPSAAPFFASGGTCGSVPFSLDAFTGCTFLYTFRPTEPGSFSDAVEVTSDASEDPGTFALQGEGLLRELTVTPTQLDFGAVPVGDTGGPLSVSLTNTGDVDVSLFLVSDPGAPFTLVQNTCDFVLPPEMSCNVEYAFSPVAPGDASAEGLIASDAPSSPDVVVLQGTGLGAAIDVDPDSLSTTMEPDQTESHPLTIANSGNVPLEWAVTEEVARSGSTTITHSESLDVVDDNTLVCVVDDDGTTVENHFLRTFTLTDFGIPGPFNVNDVTFGVQTLTADAEITVNLYTLEGELVFDNLTSIGTATQELAAQELTLVTVPVAGEAPAGSTLVVEIEAPDLFGVATFRPGSNDLGETAPSYIAAADCDLPEPTRYADLGLPNVHLVMTVSGVAEELECPVPTWLGVEPMSGSVPGGETQQAGVTFDSAGLEPGDYETDLCIASNSARQPLAVVPISLSVTDTGDDGFTPVALAIDGEEVSSNGNGVFEPGEEVEVAPAWRNDGEFADALGGLASAFGGPEGAAYTIAAAEADYGEIAAGETRSCLDTATCYRLALDDPATRPAAHWDAAFDETLDDTDETTKTWTLHVGESFDDVPTTHLFYSAIETLLHSGVTEGCTASGYCPGGVNSRSQMPVFVLRALEGAGYVPPDCDVETQEFSDVPATHLFCPWIEELARRGVVAGCGDGNYCPNDAVTRAQMAIFLLKTLEGADYTPIECTERFDDVPCTSLFADWIEDLAAREITGGCSETDYCPADPVTRGQMAVFVSRTFGLTLYGP